jgi:hypothetical protein
MVNCKGVVDGYHARRNYAGKRLSPLVGARFGGFMPKMKDETVGGGESYGICE